MKKIIYSVAGLGLLALSLDAHGDDRDFDETRTIVASDDEYFNGTRDDDDDDAKTIVVSDDEYSNGTRDDDASNESYDSVNGRMTRQKNLLIKNKSGKNYKKKSMRFFVVHGEIT